MLCAGLSAWPAGGGEKYVGEATELMTRVVCRFECVAGGGGEKYVGGRRS